MCLIHDLKKYSCQNCLLSSDVIAPSCLLTGIFLFVLSFCTYGHFIYYVGHPYYNTRTTEYMVLPTSSACWSMYSLLSSLDFCLTSQSGHKYLAHSTWHSSSYPSNFFTCTFCFSLSLLHPRSHPVSKTELLHKASQSQELRT